MRILFINASENQGGASIAAQRLAEGLKRNGHDVRWLVRSTSSNNGVSAIIPSNAILENKRLALNRYFGLNDVNYFSTFKLHNHDFFRQADVIHYHNLHGGYFNYLALPLLTNKKPSFITLHDMWSFTGHCAYSYSCDRWQLGCGQCPDLTIYPSVRMDSTKLEFKLKKWVYDHSNLTVVCPSHWLAHSAKISVLNKLEIYHVYNGIDTDIYSPCDKDTCRSLLKIPQDKKVLLFASDSLTEKRKGGHLLFAALQKLSPLLKKDILLLTFGRGGIPIDQNMEMVQYNIGYIQSDRMKAIVYSAADLFVLPTMADNLPLTLQESISCGTPAVSFDVGGVSDLVRHKQTGLLAKPENAESLAACIEELLLDTNDLKKFSDNCRRIALEDFNLENQTKKYVQLYERAIEKHGILKHE